jgi:hypothetical protein
MVKHVYGVVVQKLIEIHHNTNSLPRGDGKYGMPSIGQLPCDTDYENAPRVSLPLSDQCLNFLLHTQIYRRMFPWQVLISGNVKENPPNKRFIGLDITEHDVSEPQLVIPQIELELGL